MAMQKSKYVKTLYVRVSRASKLKALKLVPHKFPSFSAYVDTLIQKDKTKVAS